MDEISKEFRLFLLIEGIVALIFAFLYLAITDAYLEFTEWSYDDPYYPRAFGGTLLILGFFTLVAAYRKEWIKIRILVETGFLWMIMVTIMNILELIIITQSSGAILNTILNTVIIVIFIAGTIYFYLKERK